MFEKYFSTKARSTTALVLSVFFVSLLLRVIPLSHIPLWGDEPASTVRSISLIDTLNTSGQTTPFEWFDVLPSWVRWSFHDHPPLTFWMYNMFYSTLGHESIVMSRVPPVLFGLLSVLLMYAIGLHMKGRRFGLLLMGIFGFNYFVILFSQVALLESMSVFFILLTFYLFLRTLRDGRWLLWFGIALGLSILCRYIALATVPVYAFMLLLYRRKDISRQRILLALAAIFVILLPIIIYNVGMYKSRGHFDLQLSYLLNQYTSEWPNPVGKQTRGGIIDRFGGMSFLASVYSLPFLLSLILALVYPLWSKVKKRYQSNAEKETTFLLLLAFLLFTLLAGSEARFYYYSAPFACILVAYVIYHFSAYKYWLAPAFLIFELVFSINSTVHAVTAREYGVPRLTYSNAVTYSYYGIAELDAYITSQLKGAFPASYAVTGSQPFNEKILAEHKRIASSYDGKKALIKQGVLVMDPRLDASTRLWIFIRRMFSPGWPVLVTEGAEQFIATSELLPNVVFIYPHGQSGTLMGTNHSQSTSASGFVARLKQLGVEPVEITNRHGEVAFDVYTFGYDVARKMQLQFSQ